MTETLAQASPDPRAALLKAIEHLDHVLPGQAPILNFVHHNTLHGYQHLPFTEALAEAEALTGIGPYQADEEFRRYYRSGRIDDQDIEAALNEVDDRNLDLVLARVGSQTITQRDVWRVSLIYGAESLYPEQLRWQIEQLGALSRYQSDVPPSIRSALLANAGESRIDEVHAVSGLWQACIECLGLDASEPMAEDLSEAILDEFCAGVPGYSGHIASEVHLNVHHRATVEMERLFSAVGESMSLRGLLLNLTGTDILDEVRPLLIRFCASHLDEGLAAWHAPHRHLGLYASWRRYAGSDVSFTLSEFPEWQRLHANLPDQAVDAIIDALIRMRIPEHRWHGYLKRLALEIPGWSGIVNWRQHRPNYPANRRSPASLWDYLAIRLILDSLWVEKVCREQWGVGGRFDELEAYARRNTSELSVRQRLFAGRLPEFLAAATHTLIAQSWNERSHRDQWRGLADLVYAWEQGPLSNKRQTHTCHGSAWRLFRLAQFLGVSGDDLRTLAASDADCLLAALDDLTANRRGHLWLVSYERHYREELLAALTQNHGRDQFGRRETRPQAQVIFCMDDREESIRRHLEEINPAIETLGAAGFFGVAMNWRGLDDTDVTPLCPIVVIPAHEVAEEPRPGQGPVAEYRRRRRHFVGRLNTLFNQEMRRNLVSSGFLMNVIAAAVFPLLTAKAFFPRQQDLLRRKATGAMTPSVPTRLAFTAPAGSPPAAPEQPRLGFTDDEQADRVAGFLRTVGLVSGFAPLVVLSGHGSISQNNPHLAAYDCGACSGRHGGPNARAFAAMANRPEVRRKVAERGIVIPPDTWFMGSEHNTCDEKLQWFDLDDLPAGFAAPFQKLGADLNQALLLSAHERCRRFASAPREPDLQEAMRHVITRSTDFSQARPELGHATNAAAVIGRRSVTRGTFLDRRVFLISYDPDIDTEGTILEGILLAAGPVGAGINLEYYFSTVNNERFGCGSKVPHNVTGLFAVMEGASSDLRTGLPRQMVEIHEAIRLQVIVEAEERVLEEIYHRQPPLRELIGNGWILLSAIHPKTGAISIFDPRRGFRPWESTTPSLPLVDRSAQWYAGHSEPLSPALIAVSGAKETLHDC